ncbi:serine/threonine-protein kinase [Streptomyces sp. NRRL S-118]|uniref:serine/threonine-protein kinase n=1 Tax=Streptomyces sp. NRRL S-118 TaxID=1463881 RepID=UPI0004C66627|nr:serine/threonine-protein kinase [Streptomyces sp. NRRL S-118]
MSNWSVPGYTETRELGAGASGRVVLAVHDATGVPVAVKYLGERLRTDAAFVDDFRAEARLLGGLDTPHVVRLYEYVEAPAGAAIVMELVDGVALRALLSREGATGPEAALVVLKGSLLGLAAAHHVGVVHRDYKPENVLVAADGSSKLVDFGIAADHGSTRGVAGTPAYMAPEQWQGMPASPAADVYAATATFYECLTGRKPFSGENFAELALQHIEAPVPDHEVPEPVRGLVRRGLAKEPADRPENADAFVAELERAATAAYGPDWEERGRGRLAALAALLPLLFPSAGDAATGTTAVATTTVPGGPHRLGRQWLQGVPVAVAALVLALVLAVTAQAGDDDGAVRTTGQVLATTSARPGGPAAASTAPSIAPSLSPAVSTPPAEATLPATPSAAPETTPPPAPVPGPADPPGPASPAAPASPVPPPPTTDPPSPPAPRPVAVKSVSVTGLRQTGPSDAEATFEVATDGTGPVSVVIAWFTGDSKGELGQPDGSETLRRSGATQYTITLAHTFQGTGCYWGVRATTDPAAANGGSSQQIFIRRCMLT